MFHFVKNHSYVSISGSIDTENTMRGVKKCEVLCHTMHCNDLTKNLDQTELKGNLISNFGAKFVDKFRHTMM